MLQYNKIVIIVNMNFLYNQLNENILLESDLIYLKNKNKTLQMHKVIGYKSKYICGLLRTELKSDNVINLECDDKMLEKLHKYFYFDNIEINLNNIINVLEIGSYLLLDDLINKCINFLKNINFGFKDFEILYEILSKFSNLFDKELNNKINDFLEESKLCYCMSDVIKNFDIFFVFFDDFSITEKIQIINNILSLDMDDMCVIKEMLKEKILILENDWKYLTKNDFWEFFVPLLEILNIELSELKNSDKNIKFIKKFDGKLCSDLDYNKYLKLCNYKKDDLIDVCDNKNKWYLAKINNIIKIDDVILNVTFRGWDDKFNENINLTTDINRIDLAYKKSYNYKTFLIGNFIEYKVDDKWILFKVIKNNEEFIGLQEYRKAAVIKTTHDSFNLSIYGTHVRKSYFNVVNNIINNVNWEDIPFDIYVEEQ